jgi:KDO2-lipid IV(A) lauroyltransferase
MSIKNQYRLIKLLFFILGCFPKPVLTFFADSLGLIWYAVDKKHRTVVIGNIRAAYPKRFTGKKAEQFALKNFQHTVGILFEVIWSYSITPEELLSRVTIKGVSNIEAAEKKGRGVIGLTCHMGVFEFLPVGMAKTQFKSYCLYKKLDFEPMEQLLLEMRQRFSSTMVPTHNASEKVSEILGNGGLIGTLLDQRVGKYKGVVTDFFGRPAITHKGFAKLVLKTNTTVVPLFIMKKGDQHIMEFFPEIPLEVTGDPIKDIEKNTQNYVWAIESMVRRCPEQYFWMHNRWRD